MDVGAVQPRSSRNQLASALNNSKKRSKKRSLNDLPRVGDRYVEYMVVDGKRLKLFDFPTEFIERLKAKGRHMSWEEILDEWKEYQKEKGTANGQV